MLGKNLIQAAAVKAGAAGGLGIEELFQTWLYAGNGSTQTITNGIDLAGEGGLVWCKARSNAYDHVLGGPDLGTGKLLSTNNIQGVQTFNSFSSFNNDGFTLGNLLASNGSGVSVASWTFRKAPGFFDVVTYTGNGAVSRDIAHNLGSVPGCIIVKRTDTNSDWVVYHRSVVNTDYLVLNTTAAQTGDLTMWRFTDPNSSTFRVGDNAAVNASGGTYVAYLFAHDEQIFGEGGDQSVIQCGSFTCDASGNVGTVTLGWEPQYILAKRTDTTQNWYIWDTMRGWDLTDNRYLTPNLSNAENAFGASYFAPTSTGFRGTGNLFGANANVAYIAIRRGPMKTPTSGTEVFDADVANDSSLITTGFPVDSFWLNSRVSFSGNTIIASRLTGMGAMTSSSTGQEVGNQFASDVFASNSGFRPNYNASATAINYAFRRAPGFFDVVAYTGTGVARTVAHNLGVAPELIITKVRDTAGSSWIVDCVSLNLEGYLNADSSFVSGIAWNNGVTDSLIGTTFNGAAINASGSTYIAYLFATCPGVSKVGSYTGTGTTLNIDCGFTAGARFVLIKRTDSTGDWYVWDTARGIVSGNDPYLLLNSTAAEVTSTDYIDPLSSGFQISSTAPAAINASGGSYIYLAIA